MVERVLPILNSLQALVNICACVQMDLMGSFARKMLMSASQTHVEAERVWTAWTATSVNVPLVWEVWHHCSHLQFNYRHIVFQGILRAHNHNNLSNGLHLLPLLLP